MLYTVKIPLIGTIRKVTKKIWQNATFFLTFGFTVLSSVPLEFKTLTVMHESSFQNSIALWDTISKKQINADSAIFCIQNISKTIKTSECFFRLTLRMVFFPPIAGNLKFISFVCFYFVFFGGRVVSQKMGKRKMDRSARIIIFKNYKA